MLLIFNKSKAIYRPFLIAGAHFLLVLLLMCSASYAQTTRPAKKSPQKTKQQSKPKAAPAHAFRDTLSTSVPKVLNLYDEFTSDSLDTLKLPVSGSGPSSKIKYDARDSIVYDAFSKTIYLYGDAKVAFEEMALDAEVIQIQLDKQLITSKGVTDSLGNARGKPHFKQGQNDYNADIIKYNYKTKRGYLSEFRTKEGEGYIHGNQVKKDETNQFGIRNAKYTTCENEHPHYYIGATRIKVIPEKKIVTGPAELWLEDIPTPLVLPFGIFSIKRGQSSGVIVPTYGNSLDRGYFLRDGGYYFGLGEKADLRLTGDIYTNLSWALRSGLRYNQRYRYNGNLNLNFNYNKFGDEQDPTFNISRDFLINWMHNADAKARPFSSFRADVNIVSVNKSGNNFFANNSFNPQNIVTNQLQSSVAYYKGFKNGRINLNMSGRMAQNTQTRDVAISLPDITLTVPSFAPFKPKYKNTADRWYENITVNYTMQFRNDVNVKDSILFQGRSLGELGRLLDTAGRYGIRHDLPIQTSFKVLKFYTLSASVNLSELWYPQTIRKDTVEGGGVTNQRVDGFARAFTYNPRVGISTRYYGLAQFRKGYIRAVRHVITPTLDFSYTPDFSDPSWGYFATYRNRQGNEVRYSIFEGGIMGTPSPGRQGNIGLGIDNNIEMKIKPGKKDTTNELRKVQLLESIRIGTSWNIFADSLNLSVINVSGRTRLFKNISINGTLFIDPYENVEQTLPSGFKSITRVNRFYYSEKGVPGIITNANLSLSANFNAQTFKGKSTKTAKGYEGEMKYIESNPMDFYDFDIPWSLNVNYAISYNRYTNLNNPLQSNFVQTLTFNGDLNVTKNWKVGYTSGYDLQNKQITFTSIDFIRQLHCWEFKLNWIPIGFRQSFLFTINVRSSLLQDLRMTRRRDWFDRRI